MLLVADLHLGKTATFQRHGIAVPDGSTDGTLKILSERLRQTRAAKLTVLGDLFHARSSLSPRTVKRMESFFAIHPEVAFALVPGNHDVQVGPLPSHWPLQRWADVVQLGRIELSHHAGAVPDSADLRIVGHLHPAVRLNTRLGIGDRVPCFWYSQGCLTLPAMGEFTGTSLVQPSGDDQVWLIADNEVIPFALKSRRTTPLTGQAQR